MKYHNEKCQAWCMLDDDTKQAIRLSDTPSYLENVGMWTEAACGELDGVIYRAPIVEKQPLGSEDVKQGDAIRRKGEYIWETVDPYEDGVVVLHNSRYIKFERLSDLYEIRSIGETEWRECSK